MTILSAPKWTREEWARVLLVRVSSLILSSLILSSPLLSSLASMAAPRPTAPELEAALLDLHQELQATKQALQKKDKQLEQANRIIQTLKRNQIETAPSQDTWKTQVQRLTDAAAAAVEYIKDARLESAWLYDQLDAARKQAHEPCDQSIATTTHGLMRSAQSPATTTRNHSAIVVEPPPSEAWPENDIEDVPSRHADYARVVQRCHALHTHLLRQSTDLELQQQLTQVTDRMVELQSENDTLRERLKQIPVANQVVDGNKIDELVPSSNAEQYTGEEDTLRISQAAASLLEAPLISALDDNCTEHVPREGESSPVGSRAAKGVPSEIIYGNRNPLDQAVALAHERARVLDLEAALRDREARHRKDLEALAVSRRQAADTTKVLRAESNWVKELDTMRVQDLQRVHALERQLRGRNETRKSQLFE